MSVGEREQMVFFVVAGLVFLLDVFLAAPGVTWFDGGEFVAGVGSMGVTHAPGQPAYMVLGKIASLVPIGALPLRLTVFSGLCAALAAGCLALVVARFVSRFDDGPHALLGGAVAGLMLGLSPGLVLQGVRPELYALALLLGLLAVLAVQSGGRRGLAMAVLPLCLVGAVHHAMLVAAIPGLVLLALGRGRGSLRSALMATAALLPFGLLHFAWLPLRSLTRPEIDAGVARTLERVVMAATGASYSRSFRLEEGQLATNLVEHAGLFVDDLGAFGLVMAGVGVVWLLWRGAIKTVLIGGAFLLAGLAPTALQGVFFPDNPDAHGYLLPPMAVCAAAAGVGVWAVVGAVRARTQLGGLLAGVLTLGVIAAPLAASTVVADRRGLHSPARLAAELLAGASPGSLVLLGGDSWLMPALAARVWERRAPDVVVTGMHQLDWLALPDLAARSDAVPSAWSPKQMASIAGPLPGLQHEHTLAALVARRPSVDIYVNDFFVAPALLAAREPSGLLLRVHRAPGSADSESAVALERALDYDLFAGLEAGLGWAADTQGREALSRRDRSRGGLHLQRGDRDLALRLLQRGSATAPNPYDFVHLARHRVETGADIPGPWEIDPQAEAAAQALIDGDLDGARAEVDAVLSMQPTHPVALLTAERLYTLGRHVSTEVAQ